MFFNTSAKALDFKDKQIKRAFLVGFALGVSFTMLGSVLMSVTA